MTPHELTPTAFLALGLEVPAGYRVGAWLVGKHIATGQYGTVYAASRQRPELTLSTPDREVSTKDPTRAAIKFTRSLTEQGRRGLQLCMDRDRALRENGEVSWAITVYELIEIRDDHLPRLNGATAVVMELAECNLEDLMGVPGVNVERLLLDTCRNIGQMHEFVEGQGAIFHGDLKPSNILVLEDGTGRIGDLDLIQATHETHLDASFSHPGTRDYLPPESFDGDPLVRATHDVWAFGIIAHRLLSGGEHPFPQEANSRDRAIRAYAQGERPLELNDNLRLFPKVWTAIITDCLQPDRGKRTATTPTTIARWIEQESRASKQKPAPMPRRPTSPLLTSGRPGSPPERIKPRPVPRQVGYLLVTLGCILSLIAGSAVGAAAYHYSRPDIPTMVKEKAAFGRVQSNSGFGGRDLCSKYRTTASYQYKSCIHHSEGSYYGGMVIRSTSDAAQRVEAFWGDYIITNGERPNLESLWKQELILGPGDTVTVLTTPKVVRETRCTASSGYLGNEPTRITRSPFETFTAAQCLVPTGWTLANDDEAPPKETKTSIPGGYAGTDCADTWTAGPTGSGLQYRPCLYHRTDNPNLWNPGIIARNISSKTSPATALRFRFLSVAGSGPEHTVIADQVLIVPALGPTNPYSIAAPYQRWPSQEPDVCIVVQVWDPSSNAAEHSPASAPSRSKDGGKCLL